MDSYKTINSPLSMKASKRTSNLLKNAASISSFLSWCVEPNWCSLEFKHAVGLSLSIFKPIPARVSLA